MADDPLSDPSGDSGDAIDMPVLEVDLVEDEAEDLDASKPGKRTSYPPPIRLDPPRACVQEGPRCWAASLASWRNIKGYHPMPGDGAQPPAPIPFVPNGQLYLEKYIEYTRPEDGALLPENWWRLASANGMNWIEGWAGWSNPIKYQMFAELLRTKGHLYVARTRKDASWGHVVVVWAATVGTDRSKGANAPREEFVIFMDPQTGVVNSGWRASEFLAMSDTYFWIAYAGEGRQDDYPQILPDGS